MNPRLLNVLILFCVFCSVGAREVKTYDISFSESEFSYITNSEGIVTIESNSGKLCFFSDRNEPELPLFPYNIALPEGYTYISFSAGIKKRLIMSDVVIKQAPLAMPSSHSPASNLVEGISYPMQLFPDSVCTYVSTTNLGGASLVHFLISPFVYDAGDRNLYFIDKISLEINGENKTLFNEVQNVEKTEVSLIKNLAVNSEEVQAQAASYSDNSGIDYVIITTEQLKPAFEELLNWKKAKGLRCRIYTIEEINRTYSGSDEQLRIKTCLYDLYANYGLRYALLGGDDTVVPVRYCYSEYNTYKDTIPSDLFYACFDGDFKWDYNNNGIFGEVDDNINFGTAISITRLPVRTSDDAGNSIRKIIKYEQDPIVNNKMLMSGVKVHYVCPYTGFSDATVRGGMVYDEYIKPYWNGELYRFYDSLTDFAGNEKYDVTADNLSFQLNQGYGFINMNTHGNQTAWSMEKGGNYNAAYASSQSVNANSIIVTEACHTNAFDSSGSSWKTDPCLSEAFIRNPKSGVIGYLGSSRYGWSSTDTSSSKITSSQLYSAYFFKNLFDPDNSNKKFGDLVRQTKLSLISSTSYYSTYRWLQYSLNPIGDPETEIFIDMPKKFNSVTIKNGSVLEINSGVSGSSIKVMSKNDNGKSFYSAVENTQSISLQNFPLECNISVTKSGFIPKVFSFSLIQNEVLSEDRSYSSDIIKVGRSVTSSQSVGNVIIRSKNITLNAPEVVLDKGTIIEKGAKVTILNQNI